MENKLSTDFCSKKQKEQLNESMTNYTIFSQGHLPCAGADRSAMSRYRDGYGISSCTIDDDSKARQSAMTHGPEKRQLFPRNFQAVPDFARGCLNVTSMESVLKNGEDASLCKDHLAEVNYDRFVPLTSCMKEHISGFSQANYFQAGMDTREQWRCSSRANK